MSAEYIPNSCQIGRLGLGITNEFIPIFDGTNLEDLKQGAGYHHRSAPLGKRGTGIIIGHRESVFYNLGALSQNDRITIETAHKTISYIVKETRISDRIDEYLLKQKSRALLLLVTCYPIKLTGPIQKRYLVISECEE